MTRFRTQAPLLFLTLLVPFVLSACGSSDTRPPKTPILIWHQYTTEAEEAMLQAIFTDYTNEQNPDIAIILEPAPESLERYDGQFNAGLGPDILVGGVSDIVFEGANLGYWMDLAPHNIGLDHLLPGMVEMVQVDGALYAVPYAATTTLMFYNTETVQSPVQDLDQLLSAANEGYRIGIPFNAYHSLWGIDAFNSDTIGADGTIRPDEAFGAWMAWIRSAQDQPTIFLDDNMKFDDGLTVLDSMFAQGKLDYIIATSDLLPDYLSALGEVLLGSAVLPSGVGDETRAPPELEGIAINSSTANPEIALDLIRHLTDIKAQRILARTMIGRAPLHQDIVMDERLAPVQATIQHQLDSAWVLPVGLMDINHPIYIAGDRVYFDLLSRKISPEEAGERWLDELATVETELAEAETDIGAGGGE